MSEDKLDQRKKELDDIEKRTQKERQKLLTMIMEREEHLEKRERDIIDRERSLREREMKLEESKMKLVTLLKNAKKKKELKN